MGFFDTLGDLGKRAFDAASEFAQEVNARKEEFRDEYRYSNERLMQIYRNGSKKDKMAAAAVLKERGLR